MFVGSPAKRIEEDYLRILRFFRFHARYGKGRPDRQGLASCVRHRKGIDGLSAERIRQEMFKLLVAPGAVPTLKLMAQSGILAHILPHTENWRAIGRLPPDPVLRLALLAEAPLSMKERWRLSNHEAKRIEMISSGLAPTPELSLRERRRLLYRIGAEAWRDLVHVAWARTRAALGDRAWSRLLRLPDRWEIPVLPVTGRDLIAAGIAPGPALGEALRRLEQSWVASDFMAGKEELLNQLR